MKFHEYKNSGKNYRVKKNLKVLLPSMGTKSRSADKQGAEDTEVGLGGGLNFRQRLIKKHCRQ